MLLQEARRPEGEWSVSMQVEPPVDDTEAWTLPVPVAERRYCSAVAGFDPRIRLRERRPVPLARAPYGAFAATHPGQFAVVDVELPDGSRITVVSLYGIWERMADSGDLYADATLHRAISDLAVVFQERGADRILVGGDLNVWHGYRGEGWPQRCNGVFERFAAYGLELIGPFRPDGMTRLDRCPCNGEDCRHVNTFRYQKKASNLPHQNDFLLATAALRSRLTACYAVEDEAVWEHSDHRPVIAVFDL